MVPNTNRKSFFNLINVTIPYVPLIIQKYFCSILCEIWHQMKRRMCRVYELDKWTNELYYQDKWTLLPNSSINDKIFWSAIVFEFIFIFLFSYHRNITLFYFWNTDVWSSFPSGYQLWANQIKKIGKTHNYHPCAWKSYSTSRTGIGGC